MSEWHIIMGKKKLKTMRQIFFLNLFHKVLLKIENMYYFWEWKLH